MGIKIKQNVKQMCLTLVEEVDYSKDIGHLKDIKEKEQLSHKVDWKTVKCPSRTQSKYLASPLSIPICIILFHLLLD